MQIRIFMARAALKQDDRQNAIAKALYHCIARKGYANTSLKDIAEQARMSPSHIGYYFDNKAAILDYVAATVCEQNIARLPDLRESDVERLIDALADHCFGEGQMTAGLLGVIQEFSGLAVHDRRLNEIKAKETAAWRDYLERLFSRTKRAPGLTARMAAWHAHAALSGLVTNALFDPELDRQTAHGILRRTLRILAGLDGGAPSKSASTLQAKKGYWP
jgi:AcrR family transcriptional regulator